MRRSALFLLLVTALTLTAYFAFQPSRKLAKGGRLKVVATTGMIADVVRNVAKDRAEVVTLMGPGVDPHTYEPTTADLVQLGAAEVVFYNGFHLEGGMGHGLELLGSHRPVYAASGALAPQDALRDPDGAVDPHIWFDVALWIKVTDLVKEKLQKHDPGHTAWYEENAQQYKAALEELSAYARGEVGRLPKERRILITSHDAFAYLARGYGLEVMPLQGISTVSEPNLSRRAAVVETIQKKGILAIFPESSVNAKGIQAIQEDCRKVGILLATEELYSDTLGEEGTVEGTYIGMIRYDVDTIVKSLLGEKAPPRIPHEKPR